MSAKIAVSRQNWEDYRKAAEAEHKKPFTFLDWGNFVRYHNAEIDRQISLAKRAEVTPRRKSIFSSLVALLKFMFQTK